MNKQMIPTKQGQIVKLIKPFVDENPPMKQLTPKQFLKLNPDRYIMVTYEFGLPIYIAPLKNLQIQVTENISSAEIWSELDHTSTKLDYHRISTGYKELQFEKI